MGRMMNPRALVTAIVATVAMLTVVGIASATTWAWTGNVGIGLGNGECPLYAGQSSCSPYANWYKNNAAHKGVPSHPSARGTCWRGSRTHPRSAGST
jgi:hypothetical protein